VRAALLAAAHHCRITLPDATTLTLATLSYPTDEWDRMRVVTCARLLLAWMAAVWRERREYFTGLPQVPEAEVVTQRLTERTLDSLPPARVKHPTPKEVVALATDPPPTVVVGYSGGIALGNPGPVGAGALLLLPHARGRVSDSIALGDGDTNAGEIDGLLRVLELFLEAERQELTQGATSLLLFTNSLLLLGALVWGWSLTKLPPRIRALRALYSQVKARIPVRLYWMRGNLGAVHKDVDALAKLGAARSRDTNGPFPAPNTQWQVH
jgi:ribonuclease HI